MLVDHITLSGTSSYLKDNTGQINLARISPNKGTTPSLNKGIVVDISGIQLLIECQDSYSLLRRRDTPLLEIEVVKEMFPGLLKDPYRHRTHLVSGYDDFNRGQMTNCKVMTIDGFPTLVSLGTSSCQWKSEIYQFDQMGNQLSLAAAAWDLSSPKLVPDDGFEYTITIHTWNAPNIPATNPSQSFIIADKLKPKDARFKDGLENNLNHIYAYQVQFDARVNFDSYIKEKFLGKFETANIGRPLLRSISLLEPVEPVFRFYSLKEMLFHCPTYHYLEESGSNPKRITAALSITAALEENESIILHSFSDQITYLEARLNARVRIKPPVIDK